jgi:prepilin-type N-terminal cleavage/methylation domain-containing protein
MTRRARAGGFTLLEIAVALAICGIGMVACMQVFSSGLRLEDRASRQSRAVLHARAAMDALIFQRELKDHTQEFTTAEGFRTKVTVRHADAGDGLEETDPDAAPDDTLRYLEVEVAWQDGTGAKKYTLRSMRMAREDE